MQIDMRNIFVYSIAFTVLRFERGEISFAAFPLEYVGVYFSIIDRKRFIIAFFIAEIKRKSTTLWLYKNIYQNTYIQHFKFMLMQITKFQDHSLADMGYLI